MTSNRLCVLCGGGVCLFQSTTAGLPMSMTLLDSCSYDVIAEGFLPSSLVNKAAAFFTEGGEIGINFQMAQVVFGLEADFAWISKAKTNQFAAQVAFFFFKQKTAYEI